MSRVSEPRLSPGPTILEFRFLGIAGRFLSPGGVAIPTEKQQGARWKRGETCFPARQASLSITNSQSSLRLTSVESVMPSSHLILCCPLFLPPSIFPPEFTETHVHRVSDAIQPSIESVMPSSYLIARVGCHALLQGNFPTQESNPGLLHGKPILHHLSHQGSPQLEQHTLKISFE